MLRFVLYAVLLTLLLRAALRLWRGLADGMTGGASRGGAATHAVQMVRDPVCGTFVVPERAVSLSLGTRQIHFCSITCRDAYRAHPS
jgi:hypothetical protein